MKRVLPWLLTGAFLAGAWLLNFVTLPENSIEASFVTAGEVGDPVAGRNLVVTVTDVRAADRISDDEGWSAEGTWVVVDLDAASVLDQYGRSLSSAELTAGGRTYRATERGTTFFQSQLVPGVPRSGSLAFELAPDARTGDAVLRLAPQGDTRTDSVLEIAIDLDDIAVQHETTLQPNGWAD
ncbi:MULTISPECIES: hypothetical protein [unclassified Microbacterium]|uniref:hypothetical protein n=1 Tax=unclassified Microbacterium TaxID=2609290 RepID=UPI0012F7F12C|nr:hypothetical protein [Microbacterium sp. MAH-37]MVQ43497.1 hypothetical protein [Microbacterium sp. MAH-37]